jgi:ribosomal protein S27E
MTKYKVTVTEAPADNVTCEKCGALMDRPTNKSLLAYERIPGDE